MSVRTHFESITGRRGSSSPAAFCLSVQRVRWGLAMLLMLAVAITYPFHAEARTITSRLGGTPSQTPIPQVDYVEVTPIEVGVLPTYGPLASDGAGRLLMLVNEGAGYTVYGSTAYGFEPIYKRKEAYGVSLTIGHGGEFCVATSGGIDCVDGLGNATLYRHELLTHLLSVAIAPDGTVWALRTTQGGGNQALQLVRLSPGSGDVQSVLILRQSISGFYGNGLATRLDGSVLVSVIENDAARVLEVRPDGTFTRVGDYFDLAGGIASIESDAFVVTGVKRPQSLQEQRSPQDAAFIQPARTNDAASSLLVTRFPITPGGTRLTAYMTVGGDGVLYLIRHQRVLMESGPAQERPVLWAAELGHPGALPQKAQVIDLRIPYIERIVNSAITSPEYTGPLFIAPGQPLLIEGFNFEGKVGVQTVSIGGLPGSVLAWSDTQIIVNVPQLPGGPAQVDVAIDHVRSEGEQLVVKTPEVPGWFQIGSQSLRHLLSDNPGIVGYNGQITIEGLVDDGIPFQLTETMESPGLYTKRLPNGTYTARFSAAYVASNVQYGPQFDYVGSQHTLITVPEQSFTFQISDLVPVTVWIPQMLGE